MEERYLELSLGCGESEISLRHHVEIVSRQLHIHV